MHHHNPTTTREHRNIGILKNEVSRVWRETHALVSLLDLKGGRYDACDDVRGVDSMVRVQTWPQRAVPRRESKRDTSALSPTNFGHQHFALGPVGSQASSQPEAATNDAVRVVRCVRARYPGKLHTLHANPVANTASWSPHARALSPSSFENLQFYRSRVRVPAFFGACCLAWPAVWPGVSCTTRFSAPVPFNIPSVCFKR